ncbi:MAG: hypothetical protein AAGJ08_17255 [Cyanobacteria bacterium P01_H01_bin.35]
MFLSLFLSFFLSPFLLLKIRDLYLSKTRKFEHLGELFLPEYPLKLGSSYEIRYRRPLRSGVTLNRNSEFKVQLVYSEVVTHGIGSDEETKEHIILEQPLINQIVPGDAKAIEFTKSIEIPQKSIPSLELEHNRIWWRIVVVLEPEGLESKKKTKRSFNRLDYTSSETKKIDDD